MEMAYHAVRTRAETASGKMPESWEYNQKAGEDWFNSYMDRHSHLLSVRKAEALGRHRAIMGNDAVLKKYVTNLFLFKFMINMLIGYHYII